MSIPTDTAGDRRRLPSITWAALRSLLTVRNSITAIVLLIVIVSGAILFMCMVGMITFSEKHEKEAWIEVTSQILNACFTLNMILLFPSRTTDLWLSVRVIRQNDILAARRLEARHHSWMKIVSSDEGPPLRKRTWLSIVLLQNANGWFQIPMALAMWGWATNYTNRPAWLVAISLVASFLCGLAGGLWPWILTRRQKRLTETIDVEAEEELVEYIRKKSLDNVALT